MRDSSGRERPRHEVRISRWPIFRMIERTSAKIEIDKPVHGDQPQEMPRTAAAGTSSAF